MIYKKTGFLLTTQASKNIGITRQGLMKAVFSGRIDAYKVGCIWLFKQQDVEWFRVKRNEFKRHC